jgi:hypothetical protein
MKYPIEQFEVIKKGLLTLLNNGVNVAEMNKHLLYYLIYQQYTGKQDYNKLMCVPGGKIKRKFELSDKEQQDSKPLFDGINCVFELYPEGIHDTHIETAMKKAFKELNLH